MNSFLQLVLGAILYIAMCGDPVSGTIRLPGRKENATIDSLQISHVIFRHGPRTPDKVAPYNTYPNDPYRNNNFEPYGWGQLTNAGKRQLYRLGIELSWYYHQLLGNYYTNEAVVFKSTNVTRTIMSAQIVATGMYPPALTPMWWNPLINWQPIPVYVIPNELLTVTPFSEGCPAVQRYLDDIYLLPQVQEELKSYQPLFKKLSELTGMPINSTVVVLELYFQLKCEKAYGLTLPPWTREYFPSQMETVGSMAYKYYSYTKEMRRLQAGFFLKEFINNMQQYINGSLRPQQRKLFVYCMHDWHVEQLLLALNAWYPHVPEFTASLLIELHKNALNGTYFVELYYRYDPNKLGRAVTLPGCTFQCPFDKFLQLTEDVVPTESLEDSCK